jgi:hypothetical protein
LHSAKRWDILPSRRIFIECGPWMPESEMKERRRR